MRLLSIGIAALTLLAVAVLGFRVMIPAQASHAGGMDAMSIDMNTTGNTASGLPVDHTEVLGTRESCARINENDTMDADETAVDTLTIDVTALNIPASNPMIGFAYSLEFPSGSVLVATEDQNFLLRALAGSALFAGLSDPLPDSASPWTPTGVDGGPLPGSAESAGSTPPTPSGVLNRLTLQTFPASVTGLFDLTLTANAHVDTASVGLVPDVTNNAQVAVNQACPAVATPTPTPSPTPSSTPTPSPTPSPTPTASPTPSPTPTASPTPSPTPMASPTPVETPTPVPTPSPTTPGSPTPRPHVQGDVDCTLGANPVTATDALKVLRYVAGLPVTQTEPCDDIGTAGSPLQGNVDCSTGANPVSGTDALKVLRFVAGLPVSQTEPPPCPDIGT